MARQRLGQHFLASVGILERIAAAAVPHAVPGPDPLIIEIGPGHGALTAHLLPRAGRLICVELDTSLAARLREQYAADPRVTVIEGDAAHIDLGQWGAAIVAGNLPYYIATAILQRVVAVPSLVRSVFLIQKEVAKRMAAGPGSRDYGALSIAVQLAARVEVLFDVKPGAFLPPPKVDSSVVRLTPHTPDWAPADREGFLRFVAACFRQKRKTLRNNLAGAWPIEGQPVAALRAEQLPPVDLARLYGQLRLVP